MVVSQSLSQHGLIFRMPDKSIYALIAKFRMSLPNYFINLTKKRKQA